MSAPIAPEPVDTLGYRHVRTVAGLLGMGLAIGAAVAIQVTRDAREATLLAKGCPVAAAALPAGFLQFAYALAIPVGLPVLLFVLSLMLFSPTVFGQFVTALRGLWPGKVA